MKHRNLIAAAIAMGVFAAAPRPVLAQVAPDKSVTDTQTITSETTFMGVVYPERVHIDINNAAGRDWQPGDPIREIPRRHWDDPSLIEANARAPVNEPQPDPLVFLQQAYDQVVGARGSGFTTPVANWEGIPGSTLPPDPNGDVGPNHFVEATNAGGGTRVRVWLKSTGAQVADFVLASTLSGPSPCNSGLGDPIVMYDAIAERWVITEFSPQAGRAMCFYISADSDPTNTTASAWNRYSFVSTSFPDYPKYGVWPDAYYVTANENGVNNMRPLYAMERDAMLAGQPARWVRVNVPRLSGFNFQQLQPAHFTGTELPPAGAPGIFMRHRDDEAHDPGSNNPSEDYLELWQLSVDWTPATPTTTLSPVHRIAISEFNSRINGLTAFNAFPQPNGQKLDPLREPIMHTLMYRHFGTHQSLVGNLVTNALTDPQVHGAIRWFELRRPANSTSATDWQLYMEGTYAPSDPDAPIHRWMGGIGIDSSGNLALGYTATRQSPAVHPSVHFVGRLASDPPGVMTTGEGVLAAGTRSHNSERWGDYTSMSIDPVDGCTFWYVGHYMGAGTSASNTRIGAMRHPECGESTFSLNLSSTSAAVCNMSPPTNLDPVTVNVGSINGFNGTVSLAFNPALPAGISGSFSPTAVTVPPNGQSTLNLSLAAGAAPGQHTLTVQGTSGSTVLTRDFTLDVANAIPATPTLVSPANNAVNQPTQPTLTWQSASQAEEYIVEVATDSGFSNIVWSGNVAGTSIAVGTTLQTNTTYYWRVRAGNICGTGSNSPVFSFSTMPAPGDCGPGSVAYSLFSEDFTAGLGGFSTAGSSGASTWSLSTTRPSPLSGGNAAYAVDLDSTSDQRLTSPPIVLPAADLPLTLKFQNWRNMENSGNDACFDGGVLEISTDGGATFTQLTGAALLNDPYRGPISTAWGNPLGGMPAWCEPNPGRPYDDTLVDLSSYAGQTVQLRWRLASDSSVGREGWYVDDIRVEGCSSDGNFADLSLSVMAAPDPVENGSQLTYVATVGNFGPETALDVEVDFDLPAGVSFAGSRSLLSKSEGVHGANWSCSGAGSTVTCALSGALAASSMAPTLEVIVNVNLVDPDEISTTVTVSGSTIDPVPGNNSVVVTTEVTGKPDRIFANDFECAADLPDCPSGGVPGVYTDRAEFMAQVAAGALEPAFNQTGGIEEPLVYSNAGYSISITSGNGGGLYGEAGGILTPNNSGTDIVVDFTSGAVTAVGANFWITDLSVNPVAATVTIELSDGTTETYLATGPSNFRGFITAAPITRITFRGTGAPSGQWSTLANLVVGSSL